MSKPLITKGEYHALVEIWRYSPTCRPKGVRESTVWNLFGKGLIEHDNRPDYKNFWLTEAGKEVMDRHVKIYGAMR